MSDFPTQISQESRQIRHADDADDKWTFIQRFYNFWSSDILQCEYTAIYREEF